MSGYWVEIVLFDRELGHFERKFQGEGSWLYTNDFWCQKTRVPGLSRGVVCVILSLALLIQYRRVTDRQTDTHIHTHTHTHTDRHPMMAITRASLAPRG